MSIEEVVVDYLTDALSVPVYAEIPAGNSAGTFVVIERTGGELVNQIKSAVMAVQSYGPTLLDAIRLNETVKEAMLNIIELDDIGSCRLDGDYNFTDTAKKLYRYQAVFFIVYYTEVNNGE